MPLTTLSLCQDAAGRHGYWDEGIVVTRLPGSVCLFAQSLDVFHLSE